MKINKKLIKNIHRSYFRSKGKISVRHRDGGHKKLYRFVDFYRKKINIPGKIINFLYDPFRNVKLSLICYLDGEKSLVLRIADTYIGSYIINIVNRNDNKIGCSMILKYIPVGENICCIENKPNKGAIFTRSLGTNSQLIFKNLNFAVVKLSSGIKKKLSLFCKAVLGKVDNEINIKKKKAGVNYWKGIRPTVRGVAMNPVDHPHGGGEGKTSGGRHPCSPKGVKSKGYKTKHVKIYKKGDIYQ